jgi:thioredoxin-dependent peroxiredoxin
MRLTTDVHAPLFSLTDVFGRTIALENYHDKKVLIAFFRHAGCPFCNLRVHALMKIEDQLKEKGLEMIFFFESTERVILRSSFHREVSPVPIISDPTKEWYGKYGLQPSTKGTVISHVTQFVQTALRARQTKLPVHLMASGESFSTMPAEFLIGKGLIIRELLYSERLNERMDLSQIVKFAETGI